MEAPLFPTVTAADAADTPKARHASAAQAKVAARLELDM
jgi:hypothetical protein